MGSVDPRAFLCARHAETRSDRSYPRWAPAAEGERVLGRPGSGERTARCAPLREGRTGARHQLALGGGAARQPGAGLDPPVTRVNSENPAGGGDKREGSSVGQEREERRAVPGSSNSKAAVKHHVPISLKQRRMERKEVRGDRTAEFRKEQRAAGAPFATSPAAP